MRKFAVIFVLPLSLIRWTGHRPLASPRAVQFSCEALDVPHLTGAPILSDRARIKNLEHLAAVLSKAAKPQKTLDPASRHAEISAMVRLAAEYTKQTYDRFAVPYTASRGRLPTGDVYKKLLRHLALARVRFPDGVLKVLDAGTSLRDLSFLSRLDVVKAVGIDASAGIVSVIRKRNPALDIRLMDVTDLSDFPTGMFHAVRANEVLHHLPLISEDLGVDVAVREAFRVLAPGGVYYVMVKAATPTHKGFMVIDTGTGFGPRLYQLYTPRLLRALLRRHGFSTIGDVGHWRDVGGDHFLTAYVQKPFLLAQRGGA